MKFRNMLKRMLLLVFATPLLISCDYILENNKHKNDIVSDAQSRINIYKKEADLMLSISRNNLDILELCEAIKYVDTINSVAQLTKRLERTHFEISKNYNKLAEEKLISIPTYISANNVFEFEHVDTNAFIEKNLELILNKTETQLRLLDVLGKTTNNVEFKVLVIKDTHTLKSNINKIKDTLNRLNREAQEI